MAELSWRERLTGNASDLYRFSLADWLAMSSFTFGGNTYPLSGATSMGTSKQEEPDASYTGYTQGIYRANAVVFACMEARRLIFSEARFQYRRLRAGRPGELFGTSELEILEKPWPNGTTGDLLSRAIQDVDLAGNFYCTRQGDRIMRMRPDWVSIVLGSQMDPDDPAAALDAQVIGYLYHPGGYKAGADPVPLLPEQVAHWAPTPDPLARFRGETWLTRLIREVMADSAATEHKLKFFEQGATVNLHVNFDSPLIKTQEQFDEHVAKFKRGQEGVGNAFKTAFTAHGTELHPIGANLEEAAFKIVQGAGETRIAAAARIPPIIVGLSEGLAAATYSNYGQARRAFADLTMRPLWRDFAGSMASIVDVPGDAQLWYDDRDVPFLQEDMEDEAKILLTRMQSIRTGVDGGFKPETVVDAVISGDLSRLEHTALFSVQLQPPRTEAPSTNGKVDEPIGAVDE